MPLCLLDLPPAPFALPPPPPLDIPPPVQVTVPVGVSLGLPSLPPLLMSVRWLGATEPMPRILLYYFLLSTVMAIPIAAIQWHWVPGQAWIYLLGIGFAQRLAQVLIVLAYRYASSVKLGPFIYTTIVFTALIDWVVWHHPSTLFVVVGMVLVIGGGFIAIRGRRRRISPDSSA